MFIENKYSKRSIKELNINQEWRRLLGNFSFKLIGEALEWRLASLSLANADTY